MNSGWIILDKPSGMTSRRPGGIVARMFGAKTFGHLGTLDPMASGVLPIALGEATKMIPYLEGQVGHKAEGIGQSVADVHDQNTNLGNKEPALCPMPYALKNYLFEITWGIRTDTDDITGSVLEQNDNVPTLGQIQSVLPMLVGEIWQTPPAYSAVHIDGRRAYDLARSGVTVEIPPRKIHIFSLEIIPSTDTTPTGEKFAKNRDSFKTHFRVQCSSGTYVRTITTDIAKLLGDGFIATTSMIRRTRTHCFDIKNAVSLDFLENMYNNDPVAVQKYLQPIDFGLDGIPVWEIEKNNAELFQNGGFIDVPSNLSGLVRAYNNNQLIGIGIIDNGVLKPKKVLIY